MERRFKAGDRVRVAQVPSDEPEYAAYLGKPGVVDGAGYSHDGVWWYYVLVDDEAPGPYFKETELTQINPIHEVVGVVDCRGKVWTKDCCEHVLGPEHEGRRVRVTVEILED